MAVYWSGGIQSLACGSDGSKTSRGTRAARRQESVYAAEIGLSAAGLCAKRVPPDGIPRHLEAELLSGRQLFEGCARLVGEETPAKATRIAGSAVLQITATNATNAPMSCDVFETVRASIHGDALPADV